MLGEMLLKKGTDVVPAAVMRAAARALGSLGDHATLYQALSYRASGGKLNYSYPMAVRLAALEGIAYLPESKNPVGKLRGYTEAFSDHQMAKASEQAIIHAFRLRLENSGESM